jgi:hypothetical protein
VVGERIHQLLGEVESKGRRREGGKVDDGKLHPDAAA